MPLIDLAGLSRFWIRVKEYLDNRITGRWLDYVPGRVIKSKWKGGSKRWQKSEHLAHRILLKRCVRL